MGRYMSIIFEYDYYYEGYIPEGSSKTLEEAVNVTYSIDYIRLAVEFNVSKYIPAKLSGHPDTWCEEEGGELEVQSIYPMYLTTSEDDIPVKLTKSMRETIGDYIEEKEVIKECWKYIDNLKEGVMYD